MCIRYMLEQIAGVLRTLGTLNFKAIAPRKSCDYIIYSNSMYHNIPVAYKLPFIKKY